MVSDIGMAFAASVFHQAPLPALAHYTVPQSLAQDLQPQPPTEPAKAADVAKSNQNSGSSLEQLSQLLQELNYQVSYGLYDGTKQFYAKITDPLTDRVVRFLPPEQLLKIQAALEEAVGKIVDKTA